jgi:hypothetical protein
MRRLSQEDRDDGQRLRRRGARLRPDRYGAMLRAQECIRCCTAGEAQGDMR